MTSTSGPTIVAPAGYTIRRCTDADVERVAAFHATRTGDDDAEDFLLVARDPAAGAGWSAIAIHDESREIGASLTLLDEELRVGSVRVPAGQVEMVASATAHAGRGLVNCLMKWSDEESLRRGHLIQPMVGIPYFYRRFGYSYAAPLTPLAPVLRLVEAGDPNVVVRRAGFDDIEAIRSVVERNQRDADVAMCPSVVCVDWIVRRSGSSAWVAVRGDDIVGFARALPANEGPANEGDAIGDLFGDDDLAIAELVRTVGRSGVHVQARPGATQALGLDGVDDPHAQWLYARIPDVVALLEHLRPELQRRLDDDPPRALPDQLLISSYGSHVTARLHDGRLGSFEPGGPLQAPVSAGGAGIPPDVWAAMLLGPFGALGLERRHPDVLLGDVRELMARLFPPVYADLVTFYMTI